MQLQKLTIPLQKLKNLKKLGVVNWNSYAPAPVIGVDEVGRGCLAGAVVAAAVILKSPYKRGRTRYFDSKAISEKRRGELAAAIRLEHIWSIGVASVEEIDQINILHASLLAMKRAVMGLKLKGGHILVDGKFIIPGLPKRFAQTPLIKGDSRAEPISAASIVAKVARDNWMKRLAEVYPGYGFEVHKGYGTKLHRTKLAELGACELHRLTFAGIGEQFAGDGIRGRTGTGSHELEIPLSRH